MKRAFRLLFLFCGPVACSSSNDSSLDTDFSTTIDGGASPSEPTPLPDNLPAETELEPTYTAHVATGNYVWSVNPTSNRVAYIDGADGRVRLTDAGDGPTYLTAVTGSADADTALVLNTRSQDATLMRVSAAGVQSKQIPTPGGGNAWAVAPNGAYAIAWTRADLILGSKNELEGYQRISLLKLTPSAETSTALSVGFRPGAIVFSPDSAQAYVLSKDGLSVLSLAEAKVTSTIPLPPALGVQPALTDLLLTADGSTLLAREEVSGAVVAFSLATGEPRVLALPGKATDIDLDSSGQRVVVVLRDLGQYALVSVPLDLSLPIPTWSLAVQPPAGSVSVPGQGNVGFFYTNATPSRTVELASLASNPTAVRSLGLRAPVAAVFPSPKGDFALVLHGEVPEGIAEPTIKAAVSYVSAQENQPSTLVGLTGVPQSLAFATDASKALVVTTATNEFRGNLIDLSSFVTTTITLPSTPISIGVLAGLNKAFVLQRHGLGRITLIDFATGQSKTTTGFELAAQVVQGAAQ